MTKYTPSEFASLLNVSIKTLQRWDNKGLLVAQRTKGGRRYYLHSQYLSYIEQKKTLMCALLDENVKYMDYEGYHFFYTNNHGILEVLQLIVTNRVKALLILGSVHPVIESLLLDACHLNGTKIEKKKN